MDECGIRRNGLAYAVGIEANKARYRMSVGAAALTAAPPLFSCQRTTWTMTRLVQPLVYHVPDLNVLPLGAMIFLAARQSVYTMPHSRSKACAPIENLVVGVEVLDVGVLRRNSIAPECVVNNKRLPGFVSQYHPELILITQYAFEKKSAFPHSVRT